MKLTIIAMCSARLRREKRTYCIAFGSSTTSSRRCWRRICTARGSQSSVCSPPMMKVPISSPVIPQNVQNSNGYLAGSWCVAWVRYPANRRVAPGWHFWQVATTCSRDRCERGSDGGRMSWAPWQS